MKRFVFGIYKMIRLGELRFNRYRITRQREKFRNPFSFNVGISKQSRCFLSGVIDRNFDDVTEEIRIWQTATGFEHLSALQMDRETQQIDEFLEVTQRVINDSGPFTGEDHVRATALLEFWQGRRA
jgi:hypothetical protein